MTATAAPLELDQQRTEVKSADAGWQAHVTNRDLLALITELEAANARAEAAEAAVTRAYALADRWEHGALRCADPLRVPPYVGLLRDALDGEPGTNAPLAHLNEPRVGRFHGKVLLIGGTYRKPLTPDAARNLAEQLQVNADSLD